jgi:mRNA interferase RelE/StbE
MRFELRVAQTAERQLLAFAAYHRAAIRTALEIHLRHEPAKLSKSRIKRMRGLTRPQYRLRVGEFRVFYDIVDQEVQVIAIITKADAERWLAEFAQAEP